MVAVVNELITKFTYQGSTEPINNFNDALKGGFGILGVLGGAIATAAGGIAAMTMQVVDQADKLNDLSLMTGVSAESFQKFGYVAQLSGSSVEAMQESLVGLNRQIGLAVTGNTAQIDAFKELGISVKDASGHAKTADVVFSEMQEKLSGKTTQEAAAALRKLRLDPSLVTTLMLSSDEMAKLNNEAESFGIMTTEQVQAAGDFNDALDRLKFGMGGFTNQMMLSVAPAIMDGIDGFKSFMVANKELISGGLKLVVDFISSGVHIFMSLWQVIDGLISNTIGWKGALMIAGAAVLYLNRAMFMNPAVWVAAGILSLILVVDDLVTAFNGGESAIATFFDEMFGIDIVNTMIDGFNVLKMVISMLVTPILAVGRAFLEMQLSAAKAMNVMGADFDTKGIEKSLTAYKAVQAEVSATANAKANMTPLKPANTGSTSNTTQNNQVTVNVTGASDPQKTADATAKAVQKEVQAAKVNNTRGGR